MSNCPHYHITVIRSTDLKQEAACCEDCPRYVPNWESRRHVVGKQSYRYRYVRPDDFAKAVAALTSKEAKA